MWAVVPEDATGNPLHAVPEAAPWPIEPHTEEIRRRHAAAELVHAAIDEREAGVIWDDDDLDLTEQALVAEWDSELERLVEEAKAARATEVGVPLPSSLSATTLAQLRDDPDALAAELARPMPREPSPAARFGTRFHAWVEGHFESQRQELLLDPEDLPGRADVGIDSDAELVAMQEAFLSGPFANRGSVTVEPPFALVLAGQVVRGRIDAVFEDGDGYLLVDWKTNREHTADALQLAIYRVAWSELTGTPLDKIRAAFYYVRDGSLVEPPDLPDRMGLEQVLRGEPAGG